jgi:hypothetical protein
MGGMRDLAVLFLHLLTTVARLVGPGGARAVAQCPGQCPVVSLAVALSWALPVDASGRRRLPGNSDGGDWTTVCSIPE